MKIPKDIADKYTEPGQRERFDAAMGRILSLSPARAEEIRNHSTADRNPHGRPPKGKTSPSRVPVVSPLY